MSLPLSRRGFLAGTTLVLSPMAWAASNTGLSASERGRWSGREAHGPQAPAAEPAPAAFPAQDPRIVQEVVGASHGNVARVRELVDERPALARATWDWGYGDWESALGAAAHVGRRDIAEYLLSKGARLDLFAATMLGQLDVVRAMIGATPGVQRTPGPHGITLLSHARAGGDAAKPVLDYLMSVDGADERPALQPVPPADRDGLPGTYRYGPGPTDQLVVGLSRDQLTITRADGTPRNLLHLGALVFYPTGADAVRIQFPSRGATRTIVVQDGRLRITGERAPD